MSSLPESFVKEFFYLTRDLLCVVGPNSYFIDVNPAWTTLLGWSREELLARPYFEFIHPEDHERTRAQAAKKPEERGSDPFANRYLCKEGGFRWLEWSAPLKRGPNEIWTLAHDVTRARSEINEQLALVE